jgi:hypothetical protein
MTKKYLSVSKISHVVLSIRRKKRDQRNAGHFPAVIPSSSSDGNNHFCDSNAEHCYLNLPDDMVEDNPLDLENIKKKQDEDNDLHQCWKKRYQPAPPLGAVPRRP